MASRGIICMYYYILKSGSMYFFLKQCLFWVSFGLKKRCKHQDSTYAPFSFLFSQHFIIINNKIQNKIKQ